MHISVKWILAFCAVGIFALGCFLLWKGQVATSKVDAERLARREANREAEKVRSQAARVTLAEEAVARAKKGLAKLDNDARTAKEAAEKALREAREETELAKSRVEEQAEQAVVATRTAERELLANLTRQYQQHLLAVERAGGRRMIPAMSELELRFISQRTRLRNAITTRNGCIRLLNKSNGSPEEIAEHREKLRELESELQASDEEFLAAWKLKPTYRPPIATTPTSAAVDRFGQTRESTARKMMERADQLQQNVEQARVRLAEAEKKLQEAREGPAQPPQDVPDGTPARQEEPRRIRETSRQASLAILYEYTVLNRWKPADSPGGLGMDLLLEEDPRGLSERRLMAFVKRIADRKDPVHLRIFTSREAYRQDQDGTYGPEYDSDYLLFYVKNLTGSGEYGGCNEIRWMQEQGKFSHLYGQKTQL